MDPVNDLKAHYMDIKEASKVLGRSTKQIRRYIKDEPPLLKAIMVGKQYFITRASVEELRNKPVHIEDTISHRMRLLEDKVSRQYEKIVAEMSMINGQVRESMAKADEQVKEEMTGRLVETKDEMFSLMKQVEDDLRRGLEQKIHEVEKETVLNLDHLSTKIAALRIDFEDFKLESAKRLSEGNKASDLPVKANDDSFVTYVESAEDLPEDAKPTHVFAGEIGVNPRTFRDFLINKRIAHFGIKSKTHPREVKRYVTQAQQQIIKELRGLQ